ncbi:DUF4192 domain-containing protein [Nocardioides alkalitolerans]|uniref:DUF4192 domain-containing protein n=1 Tax=Nocardioides alkalitolerans TaxID=281714 RepID=UPI000417F29A|nr:DUF4192 domain-containing protein [Nocardioides alkalitolerans]
MRLTIATPADVAATVPVVLGFDPTDSLVVLSVGGNPSTGGGSGPHLRIDHPHDAEAVLQVATSIGGVAAQHGTPETMWVLASFTEDQNDARDALLGVAAMLTTGKIGPVLQITGDRWIDHGDLLDPETNPQTNRDLHAAGIITRPSGPVTQADHDRFTAPAIADGRRAPAPSRAEAGAHLLPTAHDQQGHDRLADLIADRRAAVGTDRLRLRLEPTADEVGEWGHEEARWLRAVVAQWRTYRTPLADHDVARIVVDVANGTLRDVVTCGLRRDTASVDHDLWADVARRVPAEHATVPLILAGLTAWLQGHGALAWIAYDLANVGARDQAPAGADDGVAASGLAGLLRDVLTNAVPPTTWEKFAAALR